MRRAEDGVGMVEAVRARLYHQWVTKASRKCWERVTHVHIFFNHKRPTLKHLLATGACQVHSEDAYYGHLVLRLMGCLVLFYSSRVICKGRMTILIERKSQDCFDIKTEDAIPWHNNTAEGSITTSSLERAKRPRSSLRKLLLHEPADIDTPAVADSQEAALAVGAPGVLPGHWQ